MVHYLNNKKVLSKYIILWYENSNQKTFKWLLKKIFSIAIYTLHEFFTINELIELFKHYSIEKENRYIKKIIENTKLFDIIEKEIY